MVIGSFQPNYYESSCSELSMSEDESSQGSLAKFIVSSSESDSEEEWLPDSDSESNTSSDDDEKIEI